MILLTIFLIVYLISKFTIFLLDLLLILSLMTHKLIHQFARFRYFIFYLSVIFRLYFSFCFALMFLMNVLLQILSIICLYRSKFVFDNLILCFYIIDFYYVVIKYLNSCFLVGCKAHEGIHKLKYLGQDKINSLYFNFQLFYSVLLSSSVV